MASVSTCTRSGTARALAPRVARGAWDPGGRASRDPRVRTLAAGLAKWQWPDGGWNCDRRAGATHSSVYESATPLWGLAEYVRATGDDDARAARDRAAGFFLEHQVFKSHRTGEVGDRRWLTVIWPPYYAYDVLWGLTTIARADALPDPRAFDAVAFLRERQRPDGRWEDDGSWLAGGNDA